MQKHCIHLEYNEECKLNHWVTLGDWHFTCLQVNKQNKPKEISVLHVRESMSITML